MLTSTLIICTKYRARDLQRCRTVVTQTRLPDELIVVDSGSDDTATRVAAFQEQAPTCKVEYLRSEPGLTKQRNVGIAHAHNDTVHFLDDDVILDSHYMDEIQKTYESDTQGDLVAVSPVLTLPRPVGQAACAFRALFVSRQWQRSIAALGFRYLHLVFELLGHSPARSRLRLLHLPALLVRHAPFRRMV